MVTMTFDLTTCKQWEIKYMYKTKEVYIYKRVLIYMWVYMSGGYEQRVDNPRLREQKKKNNKMNKQRL
jgi:hypothetical protein